jgi:choline dehydrogenase-like flavoprotein
MSVQPDGRRPVNRFSADDTDVIVVIGSGAGGGTLANELCQRGAKVVLIEAGRHHQPEDFINDEGPHSTSSPGSIRARRLARGG